MKPLFTIRNVVFFIVQVVVLLVIFVLVPTVIENISL